MRGGAIEGREKAGWRKKLSRWREEGGVARRVVRSGAMRV